MHVYNVIISVLLTSQIKKVDQCSWFIVGILWDTLFWVPVTIILQKLIEHIAKLYEKRCKKVFRMTTVLVKFLKIYRKSSLENTIEAMILIGMCILLNLLFGLL